MTRGVDGQVPALLDEMIDALRRRLVSWALHRIDDERPTPSPTRRAARRAVPGRSGQRRYRWVTKISGDRRS